MILTVKRFCPLKTCFVHSGSTMAVNCIAITVLMLEVTEDVQKNFSQSLQHLKDQFFMDCAAIY